VAGVKAAAHTAWALEKRRLYRRHRDELKAVEEWRVSLRLMNERERQRTQRGRLMAAIQEVQECALNRRRAAQEPAEDLLNDTVVKNWIPWLFDAMFGPDADPDVKRMALEAGDKANINQICSAGASKQRVFVVGNSMCGSCALTCSVGEMRYTFAARRDARLRHIRSS
jgi:hypothetical protein